MEISSDVWEHCIFGDHFHSFLQTSNSNQFKVHVLIQLYKWKKISAEFCRAFYKGAFLFFKKKNFFEFFDAIEKIIELVFEKEDDQFVNLFSIVFHLETYSFTDFHCLWDQYCNRCGKYTKLDDFKHCNNCKRRCCKYCIYKNVCSTRQPRERKVIQMFCIICGRVHGCINRYVCFGCVVSRRNIQIRRNRKYRKCYNCSTNQDKTFLKTCSVCKKKCCYHTYIKVISKYKNPRIHTRNDFHSSVCSSCKEICCIYCRYYCCSCGKSFCKNCSCNKCQLLIKF